ncbi:S8 family serine peptidase [Lyngbya confervoides]|uniref:S8 family serine peptidase n=1 Tax=Lyngbya confervoides BDU141951 TaxID=1574623 RepID=A0ABD4T1Z2_9CYAN|nr:S8 family serine peptidase [Lyngbya confervoides]MCM1982453.1 S8 family serine peptidase [Lyngbya confervoides BDU141951]
MTYLAESKEDRVYFEATLRSETGESLFAPDTYLGSDNLQQFAPPAGRGTRAATVLQALGFQVRQIGTFSISAEGPKELWERVFGTRVEPRNQRISPSVGEVTYLSHVAGAPFTIPSELTELIERAYPQSPPILFESPLPPRVTYHHLTVPADVATVCRSTYVHNVGMTGKGILVAMVDSGFYKHPFYKWHGYNYQATLAPDAANVEHDESGHGTAEAANIFANAPGIDFIGVKMGGNATLAFKTASDLHPAVMTNSWGYHLPGLTELPNFLKSLEAAVIEAVRNRGITVCFSGGNGHISFPGMMPDVISVGGVYAHPTLTPGGDDFHLEASNYASSFDSQIYPGRHVPDMCGLVGMQPHAIYIMLPVEPGDQIDQGLGGSGHPNKDETATNDGWAVISGTSAASPQVAGVCALLKQVQPGLSPSLIKAILRASARDVKTGTSNNGQSAGDGHDGATGTGLVDAHAAYKLARSVAIRNIYDLPSPR